MKWEFSKVPKTLATAEVRAMGRLLEGLQWSPFLETGKTSVCFREEGLVQEIRMRQKDNKEQVPVHQQIPSEIGEECHHDLKPCLSLKN